MREHVTLLLVYDRIRYIIVRMGQNTSHFCQYMTEHVTLL